MKTIPRAFLWYKTVCMALLLLSLEWDCAHKPSGPEVAFYAFEYRGERYRIRSVYFPEGESFNELIGPDFLARDVDQNGTLDEVVLGPIALSEAQKIYAHALERLRTEDRLKQIEKEERVYQYQNAQFAYEIKTVVLIEGIYVNLFKVSQIGQIMASEVVMARDIGADGILDEIVKGGMLLKELQALYAKCISKGIEKQKVIKENGCILVKR